jgi:hypothetical protein
VTGNSSPGRVMRTELRFHALFGEAEGYCWILHG